MKHKQYATSDGVIHYWAVKTGTDKQWIIFLPGLSADHHLFDKQIEFFGQKYNCLVWDAPAHGLSRPFELNFSMQDMACHLNKILCIEEIVMPVLIGQSLGGYISQVYMEMYPNSVSGFVSIDSCSLSRKYYSRWVIALLKRTKGMYMSIPWKLLLKWGIWGTSATAYGRQIMEQTWSVYKKAEYCELAGHGFRILAEAIEAKPEYQITCPVLLLCGKKDHAGSAKHYNRLWAKNDGHRLVWLKNAGHNSNTDVPEEVNHLIDTFIMELL